MELIQAYRTTDGNLFDNALAAERHEVFLSKQEIIEQFLDSELNQYKGVQRSMVAKSVVNWELFKKEQGIDL